MTVDFHRDIPPGEFPTGLGPAAPAFLVEFPEDTAPTAEHAFAESVGVGDEVLARLRDAAAEVRTDADSRREYARDWWPLNIQRNRIGRIVGQPTVVVLPASTAEVAAVLRICGEARVPVTVAAGRSGCQGGSIPLFGGVSLDMRGLHGIVEVDDASLLVDVRAGTYGDHYEHELRTRHGLTQGHWPQSFNLATVGGWLACRGAGQYSNRYGKIEDMVVGLDVVLADGTTITTGGAARSAQGPDLNQVFVGSEGTLGVITGARLRVRPAPTYERRAALAFGSFADGLDALRRILRRGLAPAVLRLYDAHESHANFDTDVSKNLLIALDEGDRVTVDAAFAVLDEECEGAERLDVGLVGRWLEERNNVSGVTRVFEYGIVYDTLEITAPWSRLPGVYEAAVAAIKGVEHTVAASSHQSHAYTDGACLYFTFAGIPPEDRKEEYYNAVWEAATRAILAHGGNLSHHHGVGLNRARFMREAHGAAFDTIVAIKRALDPHGILNPGKLGLPHPFGEVRFP